MVKKATNIFLLCLLLSPSFPQTGGDNVYEFLNLSHSGLVSSLGGVNVSIYDKNLNLAFYNPSLLNSDMDKNLAINYVNYFAGINYGMVYYSRSFKGTGNFAGGITYLNYGSFTEADPAGNITGTFRASEYAFSVIYSREIDTLFSVGINFKPVLSHLEKYTSYGFAVDLGASWHSRNNLISAGITAKNIGYQVKTYAGESRQSTPFELQAGITAKLAHAPLRFSLTFRHLEKFDLTSNYSRSEPGGYYEKTTSEFFGNLMRHMITGVEFIPHRNFYLSLGYNYQRRSELKTLSGSFGSGLSWGFGVNTSLLSIEFGRASFHPAGISNHFSLIVRPGLFYKKSRN